MPLLHPPLNRLEATTTNYPPLGAILTDLRRMLDEVQDVVEMTSG